MSASVRGSRSASRRSVGAVSGGERGRAEHVLGVERGLDEVGVVDERRAVADLGEQVAAEERAGGLVEQHLGLPAVGHVRASGCVRTRVPADVERPSASASDRAGGRTGR